MNDSTARDSLVQNKINDSIKQDSTAIYRTIKNYSQRSKVTKLLHKWIFRSKKTHEKNKKDRKATSPDIVPYSGKIIRKIKIESKDPFGRSLTDSTRVPHSVLQKVGNAVHIKSKEMAIRKFLLFKKGQPLDTLQVHETERLLRDQNYVRRVRIEPKPVQGSKDSLDMVVKVLDSWSLLPRVKLSGSHMKTGLEERNFIGTGHQLELNYLRRFSDGNDGFESVYKILNIKNSFLNFTGKYAVDYDGFYDHFASIDRTFYSPLARWAGGVFVQQRFLERPWLDGNDEFKDRNFKYLYQDYWGGYAFRIFKGESEGERTTNLVFSLRAFLLDYQKTPDREFPGIDYFADERFALASLTLNTRQYVRDRYIFRDGETEDVPIGSLYSATTGLQRKHRKNRFYFGLRGSYGNYFKLGFFSGDFEVGSFFTSTGLEESTVSFKANYFSPLLTLGKDWKMRWFVKPQFVLGFNLANSMADRVSLNDNTYFRGVSSNRYIDYVNKDKYTDYKNGNIPGFDSRAVGTRKYVINLQSQFYSPWALLGFRLNPFVNLSAGYLSGDRGDVEADKFYSGLSVGVVIRNDYLVFDSFQLSLSFYPSMPGEGSAVIKTSSFKNEDYGFQDFRVREPRPVIYE